MIGAPRPQPRHHRGRAAGVGGNEDRLRPQCLGEVTGRVRHRLADRRLIGALGQLVAVAEAGLDRPRDPVHVGDRLDRVLPDRGLAGQHQRRAAVEDRVGDVARLRTGRLGLVDHRLEHLRRRDHRLAALQGGDDDPLLQQRHERDADLDAEVAASDHHRVGLLEDLVERVHRLRLLDLRDHVRMRAGLLDQGAQVAHVGSRAHEGERDEVHAELERKLEVVHVLARDRGNRDRDAGQVHALVRGDDTAFDHRAARAAGLDAVDAQPHEPVVDQHVVARLEHLADHGRADRQLAVRGALGRTDHDLFATAQRDRLVEVTDAKLGALQVGDQGDRPAELAFGFPDEPGPLAMLVVRAVREVQPRAVDTRADQIEQLLPGRAGRPDRGDDLRAARRRFGHRASVASDTNGASAESEETRPSRDRRRGRRALPRSAAAGCTSQRGRCARARRS